MRLFSFFKRPAPLRDGAALAAFIDENAAFLVQKGIYEYSRARAGHYAKVLFNETDFKQAVDKSRWSAFPLGLAMVSELVDASLYEAAGADRLAVLRRLSELVLAAYDAYPIPEAIGPVAWAEGRADLARRLQLIGLHPPKRIIDIPITLVDAYFALMPIHKDLRGSDRGTTKNYLRITLANIHDTLMTRLDAQALVRHLLADT